MNSVYVLYVSIVHMFTVMRVAGPLTNSSQGPLGETINAMRIRCSELNHLRSSHFRVAEAKMFVRHCWPPVKSRRPTPQPTVPATSNCRWGAESVCVCMCVCVCVGGTLKMPSRSTLTNVSILNFGVKKTKTKQNKQKKTSRWVLWTPNLRSSFSESP